MVPRRLSVQSDINVWLIFFASQCSVVPPAFSKYRIYDKLLYDVCYQDNNYRRLMAKGTYLSLAEMACHVSSAWFMQPAMLGGKQPNRSFCHHCPVSGVTKSGKMLKRARSLILLYLEQICCELIELLQMLLCKSIFKINDSSISILRERKLQSKTVNNTREPCRRRETALCSLHTILLLFYKFTFTA